MVSVLGSDDFTIQAVTLLSRTARRGVLGVLVAFITLGLLNVFTVPPMLPRDESAHVSYALRVADGDLPRMDDPTVKGVIPHMRTRLPIFTANHPPLLYAVVAVPLEVGIRTGRPQFGLRVARATSLLFGVAAIALAAVLGALVLPGRDDVPVVAAAVSALTPIVPHTMALVYNDAIGVCASTALLVAGMLVYRRGATRRTIAFLIAAAAFAALARSSSLFAFPSAVMLAALGVRSVRRAIAIGAGAGAAAALAGGWFYLRNKHLYGSYLGNGFLARPSGRPIIHRPYLESLVNVRVHRHMLGRLWDGWVFASRLPRWPGWIGAGVEVPALVGLVLATGRRWRARIAPTRDEMIVWGALLGFCAIVVASVVGFVSIGGNAHARYLFPVLPVAGIAVAVGYSRLPRLATVAALVVTAVANVALWHRFLAANGGVESDRFPITEIQALREAGLRGSPLLLGVSLLVVAAGVAAAARSLGSRGDA